MQALTPEITQLFERAFLKGSEQPGARPTPDQWVSALDGMAKELRQCSVVPSHYYVRSNSACPWCVLEAKTNFQIFPVVFVPGIAGTDGFMLLWQQVVATHLPGPRDPMPDPPPAAATEEAKRVGHDTKLLYGVISCAFIAIFVTIENCVPSPATGTASLSAAFITGVAALSVCFTKGREFRKRLKLANSDWRELQAEWVKAEARSAAVVRAELDDLKRSYDVIQQDRVTKLSKLHNERQARQLADWLDTFRIDGAGVRGVGQAKAAALQSYGIETAGDVFYGKILQVNGFGPKTANNLLDWRISKERLFKFDPSKGIAAVDLARVESAALAEGRLLAAKLAVGFWELKKTISQELAARSALGARYAQTAPGYAQANADAKAAFLLLAG
jgi:DNA-binding helix-hairpin-helix protein with protein kinase domain